MENIKKCKDCGKDFVDLEDDNELCVFCHAESIGSHIERKRDGKKTDKEAKGLIKEVIE